MYWMLLRSLKLRLSETSLDWSKFENSGAETDLWKWRHRHGFIFSLRLISHVYQPVVNATWISIMGNTAPEFNPLEYNNITEYEYISAWLKRYKERKTVKHHSDLSQSRLRFEIIVVLILSHIVQPNTLQCCPHTQRGIYALIRFTLCIWDQSFPHRNLTSNWSISKERSLWLVNTLNPRLHRVGSKRLTAALSTTTV